MDPILITVTVISLALAATMGVQLARVVREERRRSAARVALLAELADPTSPRKGAFAADVEIRRPEPAVAGAQELFAERSRASEWPARLGVAAGIAAVVAIAGFALTRSTAPAPVTPSTTNAVPAATAPAPLELLSLTHAEHDGVLTITGLVLNPRTAAAPLSRVNATLFVFGPGGTFMTSGRAPLDFPMLSPGEESLFVVRVKTSGEVARYRVGFRGPDDTVLAHVDRRSADAIAQK